MPVRSAILALFLCVAVSHAAAELRLLTGSPITGDLVGITEKEIILKVDGKDVATQVAQVLMLEFTAPPKDPKDAKTYVDIELVDGSRFHCGKVSLKGKEVTAVLLSGQELKFPLSSLRWVLNEAQDVALRQDWYERFVAKKTNLDQMILKREEADAKTGAKAQILNSIAVTFGEADATGTRIEFNRKDRPKEDKKLDEIHGMIFQRDADPTAAPLLCKVCDMSANVVYASALTVTGDKVNAVTPAGVKIEFTRAALARLDYTKGKLAYLSDWDPKKMRVTERSTECRIDHFRRDKNLDDGPIRLDNISYPKGLAIHSWTELVFELDGEYREFKAIIGVDDLVNGSEGPTLVQIDDVSTGAVKELKRLEISRKTKPPLELTINVQNVKSLRIRVTSPELLDLGHHVDLAEARVTK